MKPYSESCDQNKSPILEVLRQEIHNSHQTLLEIGSGTGQHSVFFAPQFPHLSWQCSELNQNLEGILAWHREFPSKNLQTPISLDTQVKWPTGHYDIIFSANTLHIMSWPAVCSLFDGAAKTLCQGGKMLLYGPFNYKGAYTSQSNEEFDQWLKQRDPKSGIRDVDQLIELGKTNALQLSKDYEMPANNRILAWTRM